MNFKRLLLAAFMSGTFIVSPMHAHAGAAGTIRSLGKEYKVVYQGLTARASKSQYGGIMVNIFDSAGKPLNTAFLQSSGKQAARQFAPRQIAKMTTGKIVTSTLKRWPIESFGFFLAIGAINVAKLVFDYSSNPVALEQHLEHQKDPVAHVGFAFFMLANGLVAHPAQEAFGNTRFRHFIPFMGMGVGMIASNIVHEIGHFPYLKECAAESMGVGQKTDACDKAYEAWLDLDFSEKGHEWAPGLISLFVSFALSGAITTAGSHILKVIGVNVAMLLVPGGAYVKVARGALWLVNMTLFVGIDEAIRNMIMTPYRNWNQGNILAETEIELYRKLVEQKKKGWTPSLDPICYVTDHDKLRAELKYERGEYCKKDFNGYIYKTSETLKAWRDFNLEHVTMSHSNWLQMLSRLSSQYGTTKAFYKHFLGELWKKFFGSYSRAENFIPPAERAYPLHGIKPKNLNPEFVGDFLDNPTQIQDMQMDAVHELAASLAEQREQIAPQMSEAGRKALDWAISQMHSDDPKVVGQLMSKMNKEQRDPKTPEDIKLMNKSILDALGKPYPLSTPGYGYALYYQNHPIYGKDLKETPYRKNFMTLQTPLFAQSMWTSMVMGPDVEKGHGIISSLGGFKAQFWPPQIRVKDRTFTPNSPPPGVERQNIRYDFFALNTTGTDVNGKFGIMGNIFDYLSAGYIRSSVLNKDPKSYLNWWEKYPETEYYKAWQDYEEKYQDIIVKLVERMWRKDIGFMGYGFLRKDGDSRFNDGPVANGIMEALAQDRKVHLLILGEMYKDLFQAQKNMNGLMTSTGYLTSFSTKSAEVATTVSARAENSNMTDIPLFRMLRYGNNLQLAAIGSVFSKLTEKNALGQYSSSNLKWQDEIIAKFATLENTLAQIKIREIKDKKGDTIKVTTTYVSNAKIEEAKQQVVEGIEAIKKMFEETLKLSPYQKSILKASIDGLTKNVEEMSTLGSIANAVSYVEQKGSPEGWVKPQCKNAGPKPRTGGMQMVQRVAQGCE